MTDEKKSLDDFKMFKVDALKDYLRARGQKVTMNRPALEALCYGCEVLDIPIQPTSDEEKKRKEAQRRALLDTPDGLQPDPFTELLTGWLEQPEGIVYWPPTMEYEIGAYLLSPECVDLGRRMLSDYKEGKAYSYTEKWLGNVSYHKISDRSKYCYLRAESLPSMRINMPPHKIWVMVEKVSGAVKNAYCTCFAG